MDLLVRGGSQTGADHKGDCVYNEGNQFIGRRQSGLALFRVNIRLWPQIEAVA